MTSDSNSQQGEHYTPISVVTALQAGQTLPTAGSAREPAGDLVIQNPPFGTIPKASK